MLKKVSILLSVIIVAGIIGLRHMHTASRQDDQATLQETNAEIQQLEAEKTSLESQLEEIQEEIAEAQAALEEAEAETRSVILCCNTLNAQFYTQVYPTLQEKGITGIFILKNGQLPGDGDIVTVEEFLALEADGWESAICLTQGDASDAEWRAEVETYVSRFTVRMGYAPRIFCFGEEGGTEEQAEFLSEQGFEILLVHDEVGEAEIGGLQVIQLISYLDTELDEKVSSFTGYCGLEMWVGWNDDTDAEKRYTASDLATLLSNELLSLDSLEDLEVLEPVTSGDELAQLEEEADNLQEQIDEIEEELSALYY